MLIVNWKKHYYIPTIFYNEPRFTSTRKGKFFFLSDLVFRIIHKFCFRIALFFYIRYIFFFRFQKTCKYLNTFFLKSKSPDVHFFNNTQQLIQKKFLFLKNIFLFHTVFNVLKKNLIENSKSIFLLDIIIKKKKIIFFFLKKKLHFYYFLSKVIVKKPVYSKNIFFLLYQLKLLRWLIKQVSNYLTMIVSFKKLFYTYLKNLYFLQDRNMKDNSLVKKKYVLLLEKLKLKNIIFNNAFWKSNYYLYFNYFINHFHHLLYYFFSIQKLKTFKLFKYINYTTLKQLIIKKELFYKFKRIFLIYRKKFKYFRRKYLKRFKKFLISILYTKKQWLIGPKHKTKFFKYLFFMFRKIKKTFKKLYFFNNPILKKKKRMSFFYNAVKIREHFFFFLGKKRYSEEFLLLKNKKWYYKFYLQQYFNIPFKVIIKFYYSLRNKYVLHKIKDLFFFLEFHVDIFTKKYLFYNYSNYLHCSSKNMFFIGDFLTLQDTQQHYYFEKFFIFFNIVYFLNPFYYKNKFIFIKEIYLKVFNYIRELINKKALYLFNDSHSINVKPLRWAVKKKYIHFTINSLLKKTSKLYFKSLCFIFYKFNFILFKQNKISSTFCYEYNLKDFFFFFTYNTFYNKYKLINFSYIAKQPKKYIRKPVWRYKHLFKNKFFWRRKKRKFIKKIISKNIYKYLYHIQKPLVNSKSKLYKSPIFHLRNQLNQKMYSRILAKKLFFLKKKTRFHAFYKKYHF